MNRGEGLKSFRDFVLLAAQKYNVRYTHASFFIRRKLKRFKLKRIDVVTWLNYKRAGITQRQLAQLLRVSQSTISNRITKVELRWKLKENPIIPDMQQMKSFQEQFHSNQIIRKF